VELRTEIEISAPPSRVWAVLTDFRAYPDWNPFIVRISGNLAVGEKLSVVAAMPGGREFAFRPKLLVLNAENELRWRGHFLIPGIFDGEHFFRIVDLGDNRTRFVHGEDFSGLFVRFAGGIFTNTARGFVYMNQALKRRVEEASGGSPS
jgi:hypothetical protein